MKNYLEGTTVVLAGLVVFHGAIKAPWIPLSGWFWTALVQFAS
jgi:hypothetical protein